MISGVDESLMDFITSESNERFITELTDDYFNELKAATEDYPDLSDTQIKDLEELEKKNIPFTTDIQTKRYVRMFKEFLDEKDLCSQFEKVPDALLCNYLRLFYSQLRMKNGEFFSPSTLICIRAAIHRHLTSVSVDRHVNILHGEEFKRANSVLKSMAGQYLASGQKKRKKHEAITPNDMERISNYFDQSSHQKIQDELIFNIIYFFALRGRENLRALKRDTFSIQKNSDEEEYLTISKELKFKNVKASLNSKHFDDKKVSRMYSIENKENVPLNASNVIWNYSQSRPWITHSF